MKKKDSWVLFAQGYLKSARLACNEILTQRSNPNEENRHARESFHDHYYTEHLLPSIIFNVKQGIECWIKYLLIMMTDKQEWGHDIESLYRKFCQKLMTRKWFIISQKEGRGDRIDVKEIKKRKYDTAPKLRSIIRFFARNHLASKKLRRSFPDKNNEFFRYPEDRNSRNLDYDLLLQKITREDLEKIRSYIDDLDRYFNDMGYFVSIEEQYKCPNRECFKRIGSSS